MRKLFAILSVSYLGIFDSVSLFSQMPIQLDSSHMPYAGWRQRVARDTFPLPAVNFGSKGANQVYDFSNLVLFDTDTIEYRPLTNAQITKFPNSNLATTSNGISFLFSRTTASQLTWQGIEGELLPGLNTDVTFNPQPIVAKFPTIYGNTYNGTWGFTKTVPGSAVGQPSVNQIRITHTAKYTDTIDGWGKVITPFAAYKCLRDQRYETSNTKIEVAIIGNIFTTFSNRFDTTKRYTYLTRETKGTALTFSFDTLGKLQQVTWSLEPPNKPVALFTYSVAPNGTVTFTDQSDNYPTSWSWNFGDLNSSSAQNPTHTYAANGNYYVCLTAANVGGSHTYCDTVRVTTIGVPNQKPKAQPDSVSVNQPNSVNISVLANDHDPDQNALTVTIIANPTNGTATVNNNQVIYQPNPNYVGWDSFYYRICDNGSPTLCDTAKVLIQVKEQVILPKAGFTTAFNYNTCGAVLKSNSLHADSVVWKIRGMVGINDTVAKGDSLIIEPNVFAWVANVCLYAYNKFGIDSVCEQVFISCVGIQEAEEIEYSLFPNPASGILYLRNNLPFLMGVKCIRFIDLSGRLLKEVAVNENDDLVKTDISDLSKGVYVAEIILINKKVGARLKVMIQ
jgi:PKD repeat protein